MFADATCKEAPSFTCRSAPPDCVKHVYHENGLNFINQIYLRWRYPECATVLCGSVRWLSRMHQGRSAGISKCLSRPTPEFSLKRGFWLRYACCSLLWSLDSLTHLTPRTNLRNPIRTRIKNRIKKVRNMSAPRTHRCTWVRKLARRAAKTCRRRTSLRTTRDRRIS